MARDQGSAAAGTLTPDDLRKAGETMFGVDWQTPLARALGVAQRSMQRWASDSNRFQMPPLRAEIAHIARARAAALVAQAKLVRKLADDLEGRRAETGE